ncbi:hypothetical protein B0T25DRAFT_593730 [Lasiosphaeria hispida]|uniref:Uncharacterized protein n=1 Tax=Lasiosphaeria hispida TaxID=260671 RepID=A0AAJ0H9Y0_9PEZI|nr:hypothetical protein B0T25DRAFT_593730 [Lasiosphaeria hispida]
MADDVYQRRILAELQEKSRRTAPLQDSNRGGVEALFCTGDKEASLVESESLDAPIVTEGQQQFRWSKAYRPIIQFWRMGTLNKSKLCKVRTRFLDQENTGDPWNIPDLQSPLPHSILPNFLTGESCQLLVQVRNTMLMEESAERVVASTQQWSEWKNVLEWVLSSEGGHKTAWVAEPHCYTGGRWRYVVLKPGHIERWMQVVLAQVGNPAITNEDMKRSVPKLVDVVTKLITAKVEEDGVGELGGEATVTEFFASIKVRLSRHGPLRQSANEFRNFIAVPKNRGTTYPGGEG